jgi:hypothetical protein
MRNIGFRISLSPCEAPAPMASSIICSADNIEDHESNKMTATGTDQRVHLPIHLIAGNPLISQR